MKAYWGLDMQIHIFLTSASVGDEWSASRPGRFIRGERAAGTHWIGGWVGPSVGLDDLEKRQFLTLPGLELRPLGHLARRQSLCRLRYPGSFPEDSIFHNHRCENLKSYKTIVVLLPPPPERIDPKRYQKLLVRVPVMMRKQHVLVSVSLLLIPRLSRERLMKG
jgi:hypothetical protein